MKKWTDARIKKTFEYGWADAIAIRDDYEAEVARLNMVNEVLGQAIRANMQEIGRLREANAALQAALDSEMRSVDRQRNDKRPSVDGT